MEEMFGVGCSVPVKRRLSSHSVDSLFCLTEVERSARSQHVDHVQTDSSAVWTNAVL